MKLFTSKKTRDGSPLKHLGMSEFEREQARLERSERNCAILLLVIVVAGSFFLGWSA